MKLNSCHISDLKKSFLRKRKAEYTLEKTVYRSAMDVLKESFIMIVVLAITLCFHDDNAYHMKEFISNMFRLKTFNGHDPKVQFAYTFIHIVLQTYHKVLHIGFMLFKLNYALFGYANFI